MSAPCPALEACLRPGTQWLLVAPHPDDEVLAAGGLLQRAARHGGRIRIWQLSDGENNPWPQRWLERRVRIDAACRSRWGARRCEESRAGLARLGLPASVVERWHWPDLGFSEGLATAPERWIEPLTEALHALRPDVLVLPSIADRHPDHGTAHVLLRLALYRAGLQPLALEYVFHGSVPGKPDVRLDLDAEERAVKRAAILEHRSQTALSRGRMLACVNAPETFVCSKPPGDAPDVALLPWRVPRGGLSDCRLTLAWCDGVQRWSLRDAPLMRTSRGTMLTLPPAARSGGPVFARLDTARRGLWIFDRWGWASLA
ncbi:PIG-L family deacetylase [Oleiagrimonas sp. MCCC 1A03011]|uniref:PIG-L deacetylase family protein n=1 Tax=Oleiagrimonas sp. MCCC 1A03011 TaxID=1926883 RepID=UPI000DC530F0|nr:PIG-L family deacetylase [Oleiagrimonas sp. MCCC 1A03011]RAP56326.1 hypothetical protein BTJ49_12960 [Oleiagrimonas sp. MCCC 1A03011]